MGQAFLSGDDPPRAGARDPADVVGLKDGQQRYALLLSDQGTIKDDFMVARLPGEAALYLVVNAACKEGDFAYIAEKLKGIATLAPQPDRALLALQGPAAVAVLARHAPDTAKLTFMKVGRFAVAGAPAIVSRSGYTGEDGFEISIEAKDADHVARALLGEPEVLPIGLGARDSLRLEAGFAFTVTTWMRPSIPSGQSRLVDRQAPQDRQGFSGCRNDHGQAAGRQRRKSESASVPDGKAPARDGTEIADKTGASSARSPAAASGRASMRPSRWAMSKRLFAATAPKSMLMVRGKAMPAHVAPMPFVPHGYKRNS
jgi:aminomethyltransferase